MSDIEITNRATWTPVAGADRGPHYIETEQHGLTAELHYNPMQRAGSWAWSFYDPKGDDPDMAVARGLEVNFETAEQAVLDYMDTYAEEHNYMPDIEINVDEMFVAQFDDRLALRVDDDGDVRVQILENNVLQDDVPTVYMTPEQALEWAERLRAYGQLAQRVRDKTER